MKKRLSYTIFTPANFVTLSGFPLAIAAYWAILSGDIIKGFILYVALALTDLLDGFVAKNKTIQKFFGGRGESKLGKLLDPIRDTFIRLIVFFLIWNNLVFIIWTGAIAFGTLLIYVFYNRKINKKHEEVTVSPHGKWFHAFDCIGIAVWIFVWVLSMYNICSPDLVQTTGYCFLSLMTVTAFGRFMVYRDEYINLQASEKRRNNKLF